MIMKCKGCGKEYDQHRPWQNFHSPACRIKYHSKHRPKASDVAKTLYSDLELGVIRSTAEARIKQIEDRIANEAPSIEEAESLYKAQKVWESIREKTS